MYVQFHLAYDDHASGCLVRERRTIRRNYLRGWFAVDFVSVVPFDLLSTLSMGSASLREMKVIRLVKLLRLLKLTRVTKVSHIFQRYEASLNISYSYSTLDLAKAVLRIATMAHWSVLDEPFVHRRTLLFVALARGSDAASAQLYKRAGKTEASADDYCRPARSLAEPIALPRTVLVAPPARSLNPSRERLLSLTRELTTAPPPPTPLDAFVPSRGDAHTTAPGRCPPADGGSRALGACSRASRTSTAKPAGARGSRRPRPTRAATAGRATATSATMPPKGVTAGSSSTSRSCSIPLGWRRARPQLATVQTRERPVLPRRAIPPQMTRPTAPRCRLPPRQVRALALPRRLHAHIRRLRRRRRAEHGRVLLRDGRDRARRSLLGVHARHVLRGRLDVGPLGDRVPSGGALALSSCRGFPSPPFRLRWSNLDDSRVESTKINHSLSSSTRRWTSSTSCLPTARSIPSSPTAAARTSTRQSRFVASRSVLFFLRRLPSRWLGTVLLSTLGSRVTT